MKSCVNLIKKLVLFEKKNLIVWRRIVKLNNEKKTFEKVYNMYLI